MFRNKWPVMPVLTIAVSLGIVACGGSDSDEVVNTDLLESASDPITDLATDPVTDLATDLATDPATDLATDPITDLATDLATDLTIDPITDSENTSASSVESSAAVTVKLFEPVSYFKIAEGLAGFSAGVEGGERFGRDTAPAGDINGDGIEDMIFGARSDDDGGTDTGAVYILFMNADGTVASNQKISLLEGNFTDNLAPNSFFGYGVAGIGDYDGDGIPDVAVSAPRNEEVVYILHLNRDGTVKTMTKTRPGIVSLGLSAVGDLNNDGRIDLVAADPNADGGGAIHILFFNDESRLDRTVTIGEGLSGFGTGLNEGDTFGGRESTLLGDLDGNGTLELAVGAFQSDGGNGAIWILSLDNDTQEVVDKLKITPGTNGFDEVIPLTQNPNGTDGGHFGHAMAAAGDLNNDGIPDLITSANQYLNGVTYVLYLNADKSVKTYTRLTDTENTGGVNLFLEEAERFGRSISLMENSRSNGNLTGFFGGGAGFVEGVYSVGFHECSYEKEEGMFWSAGTTLFSNWNHNTQTVTGPMSFEQCAWTAAEVNGSNITAKEEDGRCIVKALDAVLSFSDEDSSAYVRSCP